MLAAWIFWVFMGLLIFHGVSWGFMGFLVVHGVFHLGSVWCVLGVFLSARLWRLTH
jgi:hypothetical protein